MMGALSVPRSASIASVLLAMFGCATAYFPTPLPLDDRLGAIRVSAPVAVINVQPSKDYFDSASTGFTTFQVSLHDLTESAVILLRATLDSKGAGAGQTKTLKLSVLSHRVESVGGGWGFRGHAVLHVEAGSGTSAQVEGVGHSAWMQKAIDACVSNAVLAALSDHGIVSYLAQ